jgi:CheY-like chemotaxis protein
VSETDVILIVEDREDDILLIQRAFQRAFLTNPAQFVRDGEDAIQYLRGTGKFANRAEYPLPVLILLDLKLPRIDGFAVLAWIRQQEGFRDLPIIVLTTSNQVRDVNRAYRLGANSFLVKEIDFQQTVDQAKLLREFWLNKGLKPEVSRPPRKPSEL